MLASALEASNGRFHGQAMGCPLKGIDVEHLTKKLKFGTFAAKLIDM